ncbi:hypothetical protein ANN_17571 [Periplaneta americana]|uniref:Uncharacterized protein n=1 Tax=Periplaneta americana TaxID=6978 RepID=A0ABQ8STG1_PERAM|nr:hypothetical protein ANN_17571 [Periplaneta americana]
MGHNLAIYPQYADPKPRKVKWRLRFHPYRLQLLQALKPEDKMLRRNFCVSMQTLIENDDEFIRFVVFSDEATFHLSERFQKTHQRKLPPKGPSPTKRLLASRSHAEAEVEDLPTRMEVSCGWHDDPPNRYSWFAEPDFRYLS